MNLESQAVFQMYSFHGQAVLHCRDDEWAGLTVYHSALQAEGIAVASNASWHEQPANASQHGCQGQMQQLQSTHGPVAGYWKHAGSLTHVILKVTIQDPASIASWVKQNIYAPWIMSRGITHASPIILQTLRPCLKVQPGHFHSMEPRISASSF